MKNFNNMVENTFKNMQTIYSQHKPNIAKLGRLGIDIDPHKYDFVFSHIPVGKLIQIPENFNFKVIFDKPQKTTFYIHIPFCLTECTYCYFIKDVGKNVRCSNKDCTFPKDKLHTKPNCEELEQWKSSGLSTIDRVNEYLFYLKKEFDIFCELFKYWDYIDSIYIGGGSPSFLKLDELDFLFNNIVNEIVKKIRNTRKNKANKDNKDIEIAMEIHPELMVSDKNKNKIDDAKLKKIIKLGVNRLSFGIQTFDEEIPKTINRNNRGHKSLIEKLKKINVNNWNLDMIYGLPGQDLKSLKKDLEKILELNPPSITWYQLWYSPRKKEREIKLRKFKDKIPSKEEIIEFKLFIHKVLCNNDYTNISGDWYVTDDQFYTKYERYKVEAEGNIGIGIGVYQYYGNYIFENSSGNGYGDNIDWSDYYQRIKKGKLPIVWLRKVDEAELCLRRIIMGLKGKEKPNPIDKSEIEKYLKYNEKLSHVYSRICRLISEGIFKYNDDNKITLDEDFWIFRDYIIIYLLEKYGWTIEKSGILESLDGVDVYDAKNTFYEKILPSHVNSETQNNDQGKISIAFFVAIFDENTGDYELNFSSNYILEQSGIFKKNISGGKLKDTSFSFLKAFYTRPGNLQSPICIIVNGDNKGEMFDLPNINIKTNDDYKNINSDLEQFLETVELDYEEKKKRKDFEFVKTYYKNLAKELNENENDELYVYHIPFFENYGVGGIELALNQILTKKDLIEIKDELLSFFIDRISKEINAFENYNIQRHALKSAISSIMARNLSHIHGSHIEPGIQNNMDKFKEILIQRLPNAK